MQQEAVDELLGRKGDTVQLLAAVVTVAKSDQTILKTFQPRVANSHAKDVAGEIVEHLATLASGLAVDHPVFLPYLARQLLKQAGLFQGGTELGPEDQRERCFRH